MKMMNSADKSGSWNTPFEVPAEVQSQVPADCMAFPGLINAHDHLEFNCFPSLAREVYSDYLEWGSDIHSSYSKQIKAIERIPVEDRILFGVLKNLVNGITRVAHHGRYHRLISSLTSFPVEMNYQYLDAPGTEKWWKLKLNIPFSKNPMIHVGEGHSTNVADEISQLLKWNLLKKPLTGIHAIGLTAGQAHRFRAVIWCPASNLFLYGRTLPVKEILGHTTILFGTDSTVSAAASIWKQLRAVRSHRFVSDEVLFRMITNEPLLYFDGPGAVNRDWVISRRKHNTWWDSFYDLDPEDIRQVIIDGTTWLVDDSLPPGRRPAQAVPIQVAGVRKWIDPKLGRVVSALAGQGLTLSLDIKPVLT